MSLIRQVWLLLVATLLVALAAGVGVSVGAARDALQMQVRLKNNDNAVALAQILTLHRGERGTMQLAASAQFDTGFYRLIRLRDAEGRPFHERAAPDANSRAPDWFVRILPIEAEPGVAQITDGWREIGSVEVASRTGYAHDELWRGGVRSAIAMAAIGLVAGTLAFFGVRRIRRPLDRAVEQAASLERGEYRTLPEPSVPELRRLTRALNALVERLRGVFEGQAAQVESLRRQADLDPLTGVSNRRHFVGRLAAGSLREDGPAARGLVLVRLGRLAELNLALGRERVDPLLVGIAEALHAYEERVPGAFCGRLNGADFALVLPEEGVALETAQAIVALLRAAFVDAGASVSIAVGVVEARRSLPIGELMGAADLALARAETGVPFAIESAPPLGDCWSTSGETGWRERLRRALDTADAELGAFPVVDGAGRLIHLECPLRLRLDPGQPREVAARWLPLALRSRLTAEIDELALQLALEAIGRDGLPRAVNLAPASLHDSRLAARLAARLRAAPAQATRIWLEVDESAAVGHIDLVRELASQVRSAGARLGLEHAGARLARIDRLLEAGLDYVKLDAAVGHGIGADPVRSGYVAGIASLLRGMSLAVYAEGVTDAADAAALLAAGVDGLTGPFVGQ